MLNTKKLLYILPDVAYLAELLPGKKPNTFSLQSFRQINGEFMDDNEFLGPNLLKLFNKLEEKEFALILPDFLFTNAIVNIDGTSDNKIKQHIKEKLLPDLGMTTDSHQIDTTVLTEYDKKSKVQLSALEKSVLTPLQVAAEETKSKIETISPLSWTLKSLISLEPSLSVTQIGSHLYLALHYIGVDQTTQAPVDKIKRLFESIKTLKGSEPSLQTLYLISNQLIEEKLKTKLSDVLPIQQLAPESEEDSKLPSYTQHTIEAGMRTLSISDYPVPTFKLGKAPDGAKIEAPASDKSDKKEVKIEEAETDLPKPSKNSAQTTEAATKETKTEVETKTEDIGKVEKEEKEEKEEEAVKSAPLQTTKPDLPKKEKSTQKDEEEEDAIDSLLANLEADDKDENKEDEAKENEKEDAVDKASKDKKKSKKTKKTKPAKKKKIIKNKNKTKTMLKMVFVTLAVFFATVGIGIGLGLGVLQLTQQKTEEPAETVTEVVASPTPAASPSPSPSPEPEIDKASLSILVANATTKAGYAGENADKLEAADFGSVTAGNAQDEYEAGHYLLLNEANQALKNALEEATELELTVKESKETEDPKDQYDAILVLAQ